MLNELAYAQGIEAGMAKFALSRFRQYARDITQAASRSQDPAALARAQQITQQAYKPRVLGSGAEGTATLHMAPQPSQGGALTPTVRKVFDPSGQFASPELIRRRIALGPELNKSDRFAKYYGHGKTPEGRQYIDSEFIPVKLPKKMDMSAAQAAIDRDLRSAGMRTGEGHFAAKDIHRGNLGINPKTGKIVTYDYMPIKRTESYDPRYARMQRREPTTPLPTREGAKLFPHSREELTPSREYHNELRADMAQLMAKKPSAVLGHKSGKTTRTPASPFLAENSLPKSPTSDAKTKPSRGQRT